ncbi:uncharacterized protein J3D65DRAFT_479941 [Phyllosticta citribraziliensis]|uniref:Uncharacterized protein n=1 Tax=Phyllosticta citribraziliensis TaxID=989973 RepID=A0ABR1LGE1_9PEZI
MLQRTWRSRTSTWRSAFLRRGVGWVRYVGGRKKSRRFETGSVASGVRVCVCVCVCYGSDRCRQTGGNEETAGQADRTARGQDRPGRPDWKVGSGSAARCLEISHGMTSLFFSAAPRLQFPSRQVRGHNENIRLRGGGEESKSCTAVGFNAAVPVRTGLRTQDSGLRTRGSLGLGPSL